MVNAYVLTFAGFLLLGGRAADIFGRRRVYLTGLFIFTIASIGAGFAASGTQMVAVRALQGLGGAILIVGNLPPGDPRLIGLFQEAKAVVLASVSETFGLVILEAWAAGTPAISSRTSGARALVVPGVNGWLFDLERPEEFHAAVDRLLAQPQDAAGWGEAGRARVEAEYDTGVLAERMKRIYGELIEGKNAHRHPSRR